MLWHGWLLFLFGEKLKSKLYHSLQNGIIIYSYLDMTMDELDAELETFRLLKKNETVTSGIFTDGL